MNHRRLPKIAFSLAILLASGGVGAGSTQPAPLRAPDRRPAMAMTLTEDQWQEVEHAESEGISDPIPYLNDILGLCQEMEPMLDSYDVPRMKLLESHVLMLIQDLRDPERGPLHRETHEALQTFIQSMDIASRYFFLQIEIEFTRPRIERVNSTVTTLAKAYGYDRAAYTQNLFRTLNQIKLHVDEMGKQSISDDLRRQLKKLVVDLGFATAAASRGDRPKAFAAARGVSDSIKALYPVFNQLAGSKEVFENAQVLQDLNEYLINYGQYESENP